MDDHDDWWIDVTDADIRAARADLRRARSAGEPPERVLALRDVLETLWRIQARQIARDYHRARFAGGLNEH